MARPEKLRDDYLYHIENVGGIDSIRVLRPRPRGPEGPEHDAVVQLHTASGSYELPAIELKSHLAHATVDHLVHRATETDNLLVLAPRIGGPTGTRLARSGVNYVDRIGNCHIAVGPLHLHIEGRTAAPQATADKAIRRAGYQVLFAYLAEPILINRTLRDVAARAGVSRQAASDMKRRLLESEYLIQTKSGSQWLARRRTDALNMWLHGYETSVRPGLIRGTYRTKEVSPAALEPRIEEVFAGSGAGEIRWGGCAAGYRLTPHYRGERTVVHVRAIPRDLHRLVPALSDPRGNLILMDAFGSINWDRDDGIVHPLLVYSEMLAEGNDRAREAAQEVFEQALQPIWDEA